MMPEPGILQSSSNAVAVARRRFRKSYAPLKLAAFASVFLMGMVSHAQAPKPSEYQVKAAYIYNFGKFVKWPANAAASQDSSFTICILGDDPFGSALQSTLAGQSIDGKPVLVKRVAKPQDAIGCLILFIAAEQKSQLREILDALGQSSVLTVSDIPDFSNRGGMIQFVLDSGRVRFQINRISAENAGLSLSSDLLRVAVAVKESGRTGDK
jgi:hypothetical protein